MEFEFPMYPFLWNYLDMYNLINYKCDEINLDKLKNDNENIVDKHLLFLSNKFPNSKIIESIQTIHSIESTKNLNIHTWYMSQQKLYDVNDSNIKIITNSKHEYKSNVKCFIFDPNDIIDNSIYEKQKFPNIPIIKKNMLVSVSESVLESLPLIYIRAHNVKGILRFSPNNNNKINIRKFVNTGIFYIVLDNLIVKFKFEIVK